MAEQGSLLEMIQGLAPFRMTALAIFVAIPVLTFVVGALVRRASPRAAGRFLTVPIHLAVLPGMAMSLVVAYLLFFANDNLVARYDAILFFGPILCMALTLIAAWKVMPIKIIPGFDRLSGLMLISGVSFLVAFVLHRMAFRIWFFAPFETLVILFVAAFVLIRLGTRKLFGEPRDRGGAGRPAA